MRLSRSKLLPVFCSLGLLAGFGWPTRAQQQPLLTQPAEAIPPGELKLAVGFEFLEDAAFPHSGLTGDWTRAGVLDLHLGVASGVELQVQGTVRNYLSVESAQRAPIVPELDRSGTSTSDVGDFSLAAKVQFMRERGRRPAFGIRAGFEMPNSNERKGIGLNTTNVFFSLLTQKRAGRADLFANVGAAILETPFGLFSQNDVITYGAGVNVPLTDRVNLLGEVNGRWSTRSVPFDSPLLGTGSRSQVRIGMQFFGGGFRWHVAAMGGLTDRDPASGIIVGLTKTLRMNRTGWPR